jgi:Tfp pilus assembly protein PilF
MILRLFNIPAVVLILSCASVGNAIAAPHKQAPASPQPPAISRAYTAFHHGDYRTTIYILSHVIASDRNNVAARRLLAHALLRNGSAALAQQQFKLLAALPDAHATDWLGLADAQFAHEDLKAAAQSYERASELDPQCLHAYDGLIRCGQATGHGEKALESALRGIHLSKTEPAREHFRKQLHDLQHKPHQVATAGAGS